MRITKIEVSDFRGFPGPAVYDFEFGPAGNLLIYGENGSGKSSLFRAIQEFFNRASGARAFADFTNTDPPELTSGHVRVSFDDGTAQIWPHGGARPLNAAPASQTALQVGCLDYRSLLETNFSQKADTVNLFDIAVNHLVNNMEVPVAGGSRRIGDLWRTALSKMPPSHHMRYLVDCNLALGRFNSAFEPVLTPLVERASELLRKFPGCDYSLGVSFQPVEYITSRRHEYQNRSLTLSVHRNGQVLTDHHNFLNEARLSAIGLVIYLAGLLITVPPASQYPKVLVLDDVLVGLDMANRIPVMKLIAEYFGDWQVVLLTYDNVWYEWVRLNSPDPSPWRAYEMRVGPDLKPIHRPAGNEGGAAFFISRARQHIADGDPRAAGTYARDAFEWTLKRHCEKSHIKVAYKRDPAKVTANDLWEAAKAHALLSATPERKTALTARFAEVEAFRSIILNPLAHEAPAPVERAEVEDAITAIEALKFS